MIPLDQAVVARLESHGERFELLVDPDQASRFRHGEEVDLEDVVASLFVFENASRGERASEEALKKVFRTTVFEEVAPQIIKKGEIQLTADQRRQMIAEKKRQVVAFIARNAVNPQTGLPHPPKRIEMAMDEARVAIDPTRHLDVLVKDTVRALRPILPIRFEELRLAVRIPADNAARAYAEIAAAATIEAEEWQKDGSWICVVRIPAGIQDDFYALVNRLSKGDADVRKLKQIY
ncbi:MAG TPA: ribosome assembly factor SBDS [Methanoregulaceae archaeon]|nr:ribosome assembly factor SBDS [Methanoregulaceae archaeon]HQJ87698.1 ribosome assembly factor SBDS [Methanoregulaceae archaeon]